MAKPIITKELQKTLRDNVRIETVYFDSKGGHHFNKFVDEKTGKFFIKSDSLVHILEPMSREDILAVKTTLAESPLKVAANGADVGKLGTVGDDKFENESEEAKKK